jgi:TolA-binding protein
MSKKIIILLTITLLFSGCGTSKKESSISLDDQLMALANLDQRVKVLEEATNDVLDRLDTKQISLENRISFLEEKTVELDKKISRKQEKEEELAPMTEHKKFAENSTILENMKLDEAYQKGLTHFHNRQYEKTIEIMSALYANYPNTNLTDNFQYWIGEAYHGLGNYEKAITAFEKVLTFDDTNKAQDANTMLNKCYRKLGITRSQ